MTKENPRPQSAKLPSTRRILKRRDFMAIQEQGEKIGTKDLLVFASPSLRESRFGVTVSKRVDKRSTVRNLIRRRIREILRRALPTFQRPLDIVVIARGGSPERSYRELEIQLHSALRRHRAL